MPGLTSERYTVQNPLIRYATQAGWEYLSPDEALRLRGGEDRRPGKHTGRRGTCWIDLTIRKVQGTGECCLWGRANGPR